MHERAAAARPASTRDSRRARPFKPAAQARSPAEYRRRTDCAFAAWRAQATDVERHTQVLEAALDAYARGEAPLPSSLVEEVAAIRDLANRLFDELVVAVRERNQSPG